MLRFAWGLATACASIVMLEGAATTSPPEPPSTPRNAVISDLAPADEYFGRLHISVVRIHHQVFALKDDLHRHRQRPDAIQHDADTIGDAYFDWASHFPNDRWLPRMGWELGTLYEELPGAYARDRALALLAFVREHYGDTSLGRASAQELARGVGVRQWPRWAGAAPVAPAEQRAVAAVQRPPDALSLERAVSDLQTRVETKRVWAGDALKEAEALEDRFRDLSRGDSSEAFGRTAWEMAALFEQLPGEDSRDRAIRMLALVLDRYGASEYGRLSLHDLVRGVGVRPWPATGVQNRGALR